MEQEQVPKSEPETKPSLLGLVRCCSDAEADDVWRGEGFVGPNFFEVWDGCLPPTVFASIDELEGRSYLYDSSYAVVLFFHKDTFGISDITYKHKHCSYSETYPAISLNKIPNLSGKYVYDLTALVKRKLEEYKRKNSKEKLYINDYRALSRIDIKDEILVSPKVGTWSLLRKFLDILITEFSRRR